MLYPHVPVAEHVAFGNKVEVLMTQKLKEAFPGRSFNPATMGEYGRAWEYPMAIGSLQLKVYLDRNEPTFAYRHNHTSFAQSEWSDIRKELTIIEELAQELGTRQPFSVIMKEAL